MKCPRRLESRREGRVDMKGLRIAIVGAIVSVGDAHVNISGAINPLWYGVLAGIGGPIARYQRAGCIAGAAAAIRVAAAESRHT